MFEIRLFQLNSRIIKVLYEKDLGMKNCYKQVLEFGDWCPDSESNQGHGDFQSPALPTELSGQQWCILNTMALISSIPFYAIYVQMWFIRLKNRCFGD